MFNPVLTNISIYILHSVLYAFPKVLTKRIWLAVKLLSLYSLVLSQAGKHFSFGQVQASKQLQDFEMP